MEKGHEAGDAHPCRGAGSSPGLVVVALGVVALAAVASLVACLWLDARARDQLAQVRTQLAAANVRLDQLAARMQAINNTVLAESRRRYNGVPEEEDRYDDERPEGGGEEEYEYDYDDDEEYDEKETPMTVKRTAVLSQDMGRGGVNFTEPYGSRGQAHRTSRAISDTDDRTALETVEGEDDLANELQLRAARTQIPRTQQASNSDQRNSRAQPAKNNKKRKKNYQPRLIHGESAQFVQAPACQPSAAAHYVGMGNHTVKQSGRNKNIYDWVETSVSSRDSFTLKNGTLTVHRPGLYYVYAQMYFMAHQDTSAFHIDRNEEEIAYCVVSNNWNVSPHDHGNHKENTCFTSTVVALREGDTIMVLESEYKLYRRFLNDKSAYMFFGLFLIGDT